MSLLADLRAKVSPSMLQSVSSPTRATSSSRIMCGFSKSSSPRLFFLKTFPACCLWATARCLTASSREFARLDYHVTDEDPICRALRRARKSDGG